MNEKELFAAAIAARNALLALLGGCPHLTFSQAGAQESYGSVAYLRCHGCLEVFTRRVEDTCLFCGEKALRYTTADAGPCRVWYHYTCSSCGEKVSCLELDY